MTKENRSPNVEMLRSVRSLVSSIGFRHSFGFRHSSFLRRLDLEFAHQKRPALGGFLDDLAGRFAGTVTGAGFDPDQDWRRACLRGLECRGVLETMRRHHAVVVIRGRNE